MLELLKTEGDSAYVTLYGEIGYEIDAGGLMRVLSSLPEGVQNVTFLVHSPGGSVFEGFAMRNLLKSYDYEYGFVVQGIAASIASYVITAGRISMYEDAKLMIHAPHFSGYAGDRRKMSDDIRLLEKVETDMARVYAQRLGKSEEEVKALYFDGSDHWFSAAEALALGLADEVEAPAGAMAAVFAGYQQKQSDMKMLDELKALCEPFGASPATEAEALGLLKNKLAELQSSLNESEKARKKLEETLLAQKLDALKAAMNEKKMPTKAQEVILRLAKADYEAALETVEAFAPADYVTLADAKDRSSWTYEDWARKDPQGLIDLVKNQPERFKELQRKR